MKTKLLLSLLFFVYCSVNLFAQGIWHQKANFGGVTRSGAVGFSIGNKGYIGTGLDNFSNKLNDFWEWDQVTNTWTQKANFVTARTYAVGFAIGNKGYVGLGWDNVSGYVSDFWEYDPTTNTWTQKANFGGAARIYAVAFAIGTKGYIGTGKNNTNYFNEFWEWDQASNVWTQKANFSGLARSGAVGFSIGAKGYIGTGNDGSNIYNDFWEWDQGSDTWTQKANFGGSTRSYAVGFAIGAIGYIGTGRDNPTYYNDFWMYDPGINTWNQILNFTGTRRYSAVGFSIGAKGYIGTGTLFVNPNTYYYNDFYELTICELNISGTTSTICIGENVSLNAIVSPLNNDIIYTWSPAIGLNNTTIVNPVASPTATTTYTVIAQDTVTQCMDTAQFLIIVFPGISLNGHYQICQGEYVDLCAAGGLNYSWSTGQTLNCITTNPTTTTTYTVNALDINGCYNSATSTIIVDCLGLICSNNENFENGNFTGWTGLSGDNNSMSSTSSTIISWTGGLNFQGNNASVNSSAQHTILSINQLDSNAIDSTTNQPDVFMTTIAPVGGNYSVRLGNSQANCKAEGLKMQFTPTAIDSVFTYQFACVFQNPLHATHKNPGIMVNVYDALNNIIPSLSDTIHVNHPYYHFLPAAYTGPNPLIYYKRWSATTLNLASYIGQTVTIEFVNFDCGECAHWGYTYLDVSCNNLTGIIPYTNSDMLSIYPNPTRGFINISSPTNTTEIFVTDIVGQKVFVLTNRNEKTIDLSSTPAGIYFLKVKTPDGIIVKKIIKE